jgi:ribose transport system permease protein
MTRLVARNGWTLGLAVLLALLLLATKLIQPEFGFSGLDSLGRASLPFAFATLGMAVVVIAGGIDLSIASIMAVASVTAAVMMKEAGELTAVAIVGVTLVLGAAMGALNGALVVLTRVPDIVVTLAMMFVWDGTALLILNAPGGGAAQWLRGLILGGVRLPLVPGALTHWLPASYVFLAACVVVFWLPVYRSKAWLMLYAIGSDAQAAFRSGVPVKRTKIFSYAFAGLFAALGGLSVTMSTGIGEPIPGPYLLASVAAVVLGGVALKGGTGGLLGPVIAVFILRLLRLDLTLMAVDPNVTTIIEGTIMVAVVMLGAVLAMRGQGQ